MPLKKTHDEFISEMEVKNDKVIVIGTYDGAHSNIAVKCKMCGEIFELPPSKLLNGRCCKKCTQVAIHQKQKKTHEQFINELFDISPNITIITRYTNNRTKVECKCEVCGNTWEATPNKLLLGRNCPKCRSIKIGNMCRRTNDEFVEMAKEKCPSVSMLEDYQKSTVPIKCRCDICGNVWKARPGTLFFGIGCPSCSSSKGEKVIRSFLDNEKISYETQKTFDGLFGVNGGNLSYDFYIPRLNLLIEYQGEFHDGKTNGYVRKNLKRQKEHDSRKRDYANNHKIKLLEIWYWNFDNINSILLEKLKTLQ